LSNTSHVDSWRSPRQGEPSDEVRLRGEPKLVNKLKTELEKALTVLRDRVVLAVEIPAGQHRALIGRGGQHLNDFQSRTGVQVQFPGSRSYNQVGEAENSAEFKDADAANIVKVSGPRAACETAISELKVCLVVIRFVLFLSSNPFHRHKLSLLLLPVSPLPSLFP
jgi:hypothetical protein